MKKLFFIIIIIIIIRQKLRFLGVGGAGIFVGGVF